MEQRAIIIVIIIILIVEGGWCNTSRIIWCSSCFTISTTGAIIMQQSVDRFHECQQTEQPIHPARAGKKNEMVRAGK